MGQWRGLAWWARARGGEGPCLFRSTRAGQGQEGPGVSPHGGRGTPGCALGTPPHQPCSEKWAFSSGCAPKFARMGPIGRVPEPYRDPNFTASDKKSARNRPWPRVAAQTKQNLTYKPHRRALISLTKPPFWPRWPYENPQFVRIFTSNFSNPPISCGHSGRRGHDCGISTTYTPVCNPRNEAIGVKPLKTRAKLPVRAGGEAQSTPMRHA